MKPTKKELYRWMDKQIKACELQGLPVDPDNEYFIKNASHTDKRIHIFHIDNLCKELNIPWNVEEPSNKFDRHYFMYKGYKFFGLVDKEDIDSERE